VDLFLLAVSKANTKSGDIKTTVASLNDTFT